MAEMKKGTNILGLKFEKLTEVIDKVISDYKGIKQSGKQWEEKQEIVNEKVKWLENGHKKNNTLIFGLEERRATLTH
jgi:hypothetical protein